MQHEITKPGKLLNPDGSLAQKGYAKSLILSYDRKDIKASGVRIKEWDYYLVYNSRYAVALTIDDNSYMGLDSISLINFEEKWEKTVSPMRWLTMGGTGLPSDSETGDIAVSGKGYGIVFENGSRFRRLTFHMDNFMDGKAIDGSISLEKMPDDSMVIATPFAEKKTHFYYNQKINCMPASGKVTLGDTEYVFEASNSFGTLDWGRGVWTYKNTWYWGSASGIANGKRFGFNIGYGFGDTSGASENMLFYDGKAHKLEDVSFNIPRTEDGKDDFMSPWTFTSSDGRFEMDFIPVIDRASNTDFVVLGSDQHQVFGLFSGKAVLDDGTEIEIADFMGFAEKVKNKW